jgi:hypothetical protein
VFAVVWLLLAVAGPGPRLTVLDLGDDWAPRIFSETNDLPQSHRKQFVALANQRPDAAGGSAWRDRFYELYGIFPTFSVIRARLLDSNRHACHAAIDGQALRAIKRTTTPWDPGAAAATPARRAALSVVQRHLACEGLLAAAARDGSFDAPTREALALYQRLHMLPSPPVVDSETREAFLTDSRELDFRTLLRALRERVVDATGLVEDGSALNAWEPVLGRFIDSSEYRHQLREQPVRGGAPDLVSRATEAAARALGWTSPDAATESLARGLPPQVALQLPPAPAYHAAEMELRAEIDRGDVWTAYPLDVEGRLRPSPVRNRPTLTLYARTEEGEIALVRWPTTIGAWKPEKLDDEGVGLRYKPSPVGRFFWRDLVAAPAWFPPPTTPDRELVRRGQDGRWRPDQEAVGPGYRSAYGLIALLHDRAVETSAGTTAFADIQIRTHGSSNYRSILRGSSHGCHRLFNHLALRLGTFLLAHRQHDRRGLVEERYLRTVRWKGRAFKLHAEERGYRYEIDPPVPVDVLPGRKVLPRRIPELPTKPGAPQPHPAPATTPQTCGGPMCGRDLEGPLASVAPRPRSCYALIVSRASRLSARSQNAEADGSCRSDSCLSSASCSRSM